MRTETINIYAFDELSETAKQKAIIDNHYINTDYDWWDYIYDEFRAYGFEIEGFDVDRANSVGGGFMVNGEDFANNVLNPKHDYYRGEGAGLNGLATQYLKAIQGIEDEEELENIEVNFENEIKDLILDELRTEYEYITKEEQIISAIEGYDYEFTVDGERF